MCYIRQPLRFLLKTGTERIQNFAPFRWRIWLALSEFLCLLADQNVTFITLFCTKSPFFCTVLPKNHSREMFSCILLRKKIATLVSNLWNHGFFIITKYTGKWCLLVHTRHKCVLPGFPFFEEFVTSLDWVQSQFLPALTTIYENKRNHYKTVQAWIYSGFLFETATVASITAMIVFHIILHPAVLTNKWFSYIHNFRKPLIRHILKNNLW